MHSRTFRISALLLLPLLIFLVVQFFLPDYNTRLSEADALLSNWDLPGTVTLLRQLVADYPDSLRVRRIYAESLLKRGDLREASREYAFLVDSDTTERLSHLLSLALSLYYLGDLRASDSIAKEALESLTEHPDPILQAKGYHIVGRTLFDRASYEPALAFQRKSLDYARASGSPQGVADALRQIGVLYWYAGKTDSAHQVFYSQALSLYRQIDDRIGEATTLNNIGVATGRSEYCLQAFVIRKRIGDQIGLADSYYFVTAPLPGGYWNDLDYSFRVKSLLLSTEIGYAWGREVAARAVDQMVFSSFDSLHFAPGITDTSGTFGEAMIYRLQATSVNLARRQKWSEAALLRGRIVFLCDSLNYTQGLGMALAQYSESLSMTGQHADAIKAALRLKDVWVGSPSTDAVLARIYHAAGKYRHAIPILRSLVDRYDELYREAMGKQSITSSISAGRLLYDRLTLYELLIDCHARVNDVDSAFLAMEQSRAIPIGYGMSGGQEDLAERYYDVLEAIDRGDPSTETLVDQFTEAAGRAGVVHAMVTAASGLFDRPSPVLLEQIQQQLHVNEVMLEYFLGTRNAFVCAIRRDRALLLRLDALVGDINSAARILPELILRGKTTPGDSLWKGPASFLYSSLLQPVDTMIYDGDHLMISPHGLLHGVPFAVLTDGNHQFIVDHLALSMVRSAGSILEEKKRPQGPTAIAVVPDRTSLRFAESEVGYIPSAIYPSKAMMLDDDATAVEFLRRSADADLVHIAAHGSVDRWDPFSSQLQLWDRPLELHEILGVRFSARLVVISACETGYGAGMLGDLSYGHVVVSFPNAFLAAGASSVLAPLWIVEDQSTATLIKAFYLHLARLEVDPHRKSRTTLPEALALAQREFLRGSPRTHPFYWAGFQITGLAN